MFEKKIKKKVVNELFRYIEFIKNIKASDIARDLNISKQAVSGKKKAKLTQSIRELVILKRKYLVDWQDVGLQIEKQFDREKLEEE